MYICLCSYSTNHNLGARHIKTLVLNGRGPLKLLHLYGNFAIVVTTSSAERRQACRSPAALCNYNVHADNAGATYSVHVYCTCTHCRVRAHTCTGHQHLITGSLISSIRWISLAEPAASPQEVRMKLDTCLEALFSFPNTHTAPRCVH